jgi:hypothetical protein
MSRLERISRVLKPDSYERFAVSLIVLEGFFQLFYVSRLKLS